MIFDTHAHYDDKQFDQDREELLGSMKANGVGSIVNISASYESNIDSLNLAKSYPFIFAALGIHPDEIGDMTEEKYEAFTSLYEEEKVVAVGEIGLDYYWDTYPREMQELWFERQIKEASLRNLPICVHSREAAEDTFKILSKYEGSVKGVMHAFSYSVEMAREYVKMGYYIGVGGVVTFKNGRKLKEVVRDIPMERIVLETDAPYLSPEPFRGKRNDSTKLIYVVDEIAALKDMKPDEVIKITNENAKRLYKIKTGDIDE